MDDINIIKQWFDSITKEEFKIAYEGAKKLAKTIPADKIEWIPVEITKEGINWNPKKIV